MNNCLVLDESEPRRFLKLFKKLRNQDSSPVADEKRGKKLRENAWTKSFIYA